VSANIAKQIAKTSTLTLISAKKEPNHLSAPPQHQWQSTTLIIMMLLANAGQLAFLLVQALEITFSAQNYANVYQDAMLASFSTLLESVKKFQTLIVFRILRSSTLI
jgi:hypothetical protein